MGASYFKTDKFKEGIRTEEMPIHLAEQVEGDIYVQDTYFKNVDIRVHYNIITGDIITGAVIAQNLWANVNTTFSHSISASIITPVASAIALIAQRDLLLWLHAQRDPIISEVIRASGFVDERGFVNYSAIEKTYDRVLQALGRQSVNEMTPLQKAASHVLPLNIEDIHAGSDVEHLTQEMAQYQVKPSL